MPKKTKKYPRSIVVDIVPENYYNFDGLLLDFNTQKILGFRNNERHPLIGKTKLQFRRDRQKNGKKVLHESINPTNDSWFNANKQLLSYDHLIAIDTNTNYLNKSTVSITAAHHVVPKALGANSAFCQESVLALIEIWNVVEKPENLGWWQILQAIEKSSNDFSGTIGLIVDSDLGNHKDFNSRTKPIIGDYYLPNNVMLIYGSDKGGQEHLSTKMIKYCHDLASDLYKKENLVMNIAGLHEGLEGLYSHIRQWDIEAMELRPFVPLS